MLEGSPCPGEVREAMSVLRNCGRRDGTWKHFNWRMPECCFDVRPSEKDLPFCLVLHMYGESWPSLSHQHRTPPPPGSLHVYLHRFLLTLLSVKSLPDTAHLTDGYWRAALAHLKSFDSDSKLRAQTRSAFKLEFVAIDSFL